MKVWIALTRKCKICSTQSSRPRIVSKEPSTSTRRSRRDSGSMRSRGRKTISRSVRSGKKAIRIKLSILRCAKTTRSNKSRTLMIPQKIGISQIRNWMTRSRLIQIRMRQKWRKSKKTSECCKSNFLTQIAKSILMM